MDRPSRACGAGAPVPCARSRPTGAPPSPNHRSSSRLVDSFTARISRRTVSRCASGLCWVFASSRGPEDQGRRRRTGTRHGGSVGPSTTSCVTLATGLWREHAHHGQPCSPGAQHCQKLAAQRPGSRGATHTGPPQRHNLPRHRSRARAQPHSICAGDKAKSSHAAMRAPRWDAPARARPGTCVPRPWRRGRHPGRAADSGNADQHHTRAGSPHPLHPEPYDDQPTAHTPHRTTATNPSTDTGHKQPRSAQHQPEPRRKSKSVDRGEGDFAGASPGLPAPATKRTHSTTPHRRSGSAERVKLEATPNSAAKVTVTRFRRIMTSIFNAVGKPSLGDGARSSEVGGSRR